MLLIVFPNNCLHSFCARHGRFFAQKSCGNTQTIPSNLSNLP